MVRGVKIYGNPVLCKQAEDIAKIDSGIKCLAEDMMETMYHYNGVGLAAPQVGVSLRLITVDPRDPVFPPQAMINPKISNRTGEAIAEEGCLSVPQIYGPVKRALKITVTYTDIQGKEHTEELTGLPARIVQHEIDHLNGVLFINRMEETALEPVLEQLRILKKERKELEKLGPQIIQHGKEI